MSTNGDLFTSVSLEFVSGVIIGTSIDCLFDHLNKNIDCPSSLLKSSLLSIFQVAITMGISIPFVSLSGLNLTSSPSGGIVFYMSLFQVQQGLWLRSRQSTSELRRQLLDTPEPPKRDFGRWY